MCRCASRMFKVRRRASRTQDPVGTRFRRCNTTKQGHNTGPLLSSQPREGPRMTRRTANTEDWLPVCRLAQLEVDRGATALVHGQAIALFRTRGDTVYALGNHDPFAKASVLARGIVGSRGDV